MRTVTDLFVMNNKESNFKTKTIRNTSKNGKNSIEEKDFFDLLHPVFDRSRKQREINNKIIIEVLNFIKLLYSQEIK